MSGLLSGKRPTNLGVKEGRLKPPSKTDNSVSSQAQLWPGASTHRSAQIDPLPLRKGDAKATMTKLKAILAAMPGTTVVTARNDYLHAECQTRLLKFTDDLEFWIDRKNSVVQVRSASRIGSKDFGANRKRVETIRARLGAGG
ncbi:MAG: DUF1499 domain-containing protein [Rubrivivax sp.]